MLIRVSLLLLGMLITKSKCQGFDTLIVSEHKLPNIAGLMSGRLSRIPSDCFCLPVNQECESASLSLLKVSNVNTGTTCANSGQKMCCPQGSGNSPGLSPNPSPADAPQRRPIRRPAEESVTTSAGGGTCGISEPIPYREAISPEADFGEYPWMALILDLDDNYLGGGVLISPEWVLTAVHVLKDATTKVRLGDYDVRTPQDHPDYPNVEAVVDNMIKHPNYDPRTLVNDLALLHFQPVDLQAYPHIGTACLPEQGQLFFSRNENCWTSGWGKEMFSESSPFQVILKEVDVPMVDPFVCESRLQSTRLGSDFKLDSRAFVCAGGVPGKDACTGDGGSPLVCPSNRGWTVTGLVAWGIGCADADIPGVYVNVANYVDFIRQYVRI